VKQLQSFIYEVLRAMTINILKTDANVNYIYIYMNGENYIMRS